MNRKSKCATVTEVRPLKNYRLSLVFSDGANGIVDLAGDIVGRGGDFAALTEPTYFGKVEINNELGTIQWPNGVDYCPDLLRERLKTQRSQPRCLRRAS